MELFDGFGASRMTVSRGFANWVIALRLEVCFTISLRLFATAFPFQHCSSSLALSRNHSK